MTMRWSFVGALGEGDALDWGGDGSGNIPASGHFLPDSDDTKLYLAIRAHAREVRYCGRQVDWGAFAIKVNGPEMMSVLEECYANFDGMPPDSIPARYADFARSLGPDRAVAMVSCEL